MSDDGWEQASVSKTFITGDGCAPATPRTKLRLGPIARQNQSIPSVSHLTRRLWKSDGRSWRWGGTEGEIRAYPNKLISTISTRFLPMDPWSAPKVWLHTAATRLTRRGAGEGWRAAAFTGKDMISRQVVLFEVFAAYFQSHSDL